MTSASRLSNCLFSWFTSPMTPAFIGAFASVHDIPKGYDRIFVCVGRSNVGKSSFVNALTHSSISRVSGTPGRTQTINAFSFGSRQLLIDLPGYGYAKHAKERRQELESRIYETVASIEPLTRIFVIIDSAVGITDLDQEMLAFLRAEHLPFAVLANKADKLNQKERFAQEKAICSHLSADEEVIFCSAKTAYGFTSIRQLMQESSS